MVKPLLLSSLWTSQGLKNVWAPQGRHLELNVCDGLQEGSSGPDGIKGLCVTWDLEGIIEVNVCDSSQEGPQDQKCIEALQAGCRKTWEHPNVGGRIVEYPIVGWKCGKTPRLLGKKELKKDEKNNRIKNTNGEDTLSTEDSKIFKMLVGDSVPWISFIAKISLSMYCQRLNQGVQEQQYKNKESFSDVVLLF